MSEEIPRPARSTTAALPGSRVSATRDTQGPPDRASRDGAGSNRLAGETSPYLLQHAHNPVDWYPWGEEALGRAKELDRPILLSVGYAACHWCHVMERESFEDPGTAALMNDHFVCIKVDREERPDIDEIYMAATIGLTGSGGWPMTVFLTPDGEPFFAGTYFPPRDSMGRPGFPRLLELVARAWRGERDEICSQAARVGEHVARQIGEASPGSLSWESIDLAVASLRRAFDSRWGGFGGAPKFPAPHTLELLLRHHRRTRDDHALAMATTTLDAMARGGIFDHVGGGFARYSTDERWLVPHFEKMLYDNAQLARAYVDAFVATGESRFADVARATLDYLLAEMQSPEGGFYSSTDADSEGEEGKFFVWRRAEIEELLDRDDARAVCAAYDVTEEGNWEGKTILNRPVAPAVVASQLGCSVEELEGRLARARRALYDARSKRVAPACDDKVLASWNGLAVGALAEAGRVLGERRYLEAARRAARFLLERMRRPDGSLAHSARAGRVRDESFLEDYAFVADALLDLAEAVEQDAAAELREAALGLARRMLDGFADSVGGGFFASPREQRTPVVRARDPMSGPLPSPTAVAARVLARLAALTDRAEWRELAGGALASLGGAVARMPSAHASVLVALDLILEGPVEVVLVGSRADPALLELERELARHYLPNRCIVHHEPSEAERPNEVVSSSLLQGKQLVDGHAAAYVCRGSTCLAPVTTAAALGRLLEGELSSIPTSDDAARSSVAPPRLAGAATARGTGRFEARARASLGLDRAAEPGSERVGGTEPLPPFVSLGRTGLRVGRFGFGGYRVDDASPENSAALEAALLSGCNLIDTSTNYTGGASERLVGKVLSQLVRRGELRRDEIVVVSKIGYLQGRSLERARERERVGRAWPEIVRYADDCWHCVHPDFLREELERSLDRLGLETLDLLLLHNPEYFFSDRAHRHVDVGERERAAFYDRIERAFAYLESAVRDGKIRGYGVSSNSVAEPQSDPERTDLRRLIAAAERAAGTDNHFVALQLPVNLVESRAVIAAVDGEHDQDSSEHGEHPSLLDLARQRSIAVLANRPLNAIVEGKLARLVDAHDDLSPTTHGRLDPRSRLAQRAAHSRARIVHQWLDGLIGGSTEGEPLSRKVLWALASTPGIDVVLVGMRRPAYVSDAMAVLGWGRARDVRKSYRALRDVDFTTLV